MTVLEEEVRGKFRQGGGHESTEGMGAAEGRKRRGASFPGYLSLEYTKRSSWLARLLPLYDYLAIFTADHIFRFCALSDNHAGVNFNARSDEQGSALLGIEQTVGDGLACLKCNQGSLFAVI